MDKFSYTLALVPLIIAALVIAAPLAILNFLLEVLSLHRLFWVNWYGRKRAKIIFDITRKWAAEKGIEKAAIEKLIKEHRDAIIWGEGNETADRILGEPHPLIRSDFPPLKPR